MIFLRNRLKIHQNIITLCVVGRELRYLLRYMKEHMMWAQLAVVFYNLVSPSQLWPFLSHLNKKIKTLSSRLNIICLSGSLNNTSASKSLHIVKVGWAAQTEKLHLFLILLLNWYYFCMELRNQLRNSFSQLCWFVLSCTKHSHTMTRKVCIYINFVNQHNNISMMLKQVRRCFRKELFVNDISYFQR